MSDTTDGSDYTIVGTTTTIPTITDGAGGASNTFTITDANVYHNYEVYSNTDIGYFFKSIGVLIANKVDRCTACQKDSKYIVLTYKGLGLDRNICKDCCIPVVDKIFGVNINPKVEQVLYGQKEETSGSQK